MQISGCSALVTGGASGLGLATVKRLIAGNAKVVIADLPTSDGESIARQLGANARFVPADVCSTEELDAACDAAEGLGPLRILVNCAGRGGALRLVDKDGHPGSLELFETVVRVNLVGTFNALRLTASRMSKNESVDGERGVCVLTSSVAAYEGQIGQVPYACAKGGITSMTLVAARDLSSKEIRVCTIAPGLFDTPLLARLPQDVKTSLGKMVPHPSRLGRPGEFAMLAMHIVENPMLNGETLRLDGAIRMAPR